MKVTVIGTGYVGLVTGTCLADMGNDVICHDINDNKIARLQRGDVPIYEPGINELLRENTEQGRLQFTTDIAAALARAQICIIAVGTPPRADGSAELSYVMGAAQSIARHMTGPLLVAMKSTVPVGTCDRVQDALTAGLTERGVEHWCEVASNPEFLKEGVAVEDFMRPDRIVVGVRSEQAEAMLRQLYRVFVRSGRPFLVMDVCSSEMTKLAANAMLAVRISLVNEFANICERVGADITLVRQGIGSDERIGMAFLHAGIGYGGSCFPKDLKALAQLGEDADTRVDILEAADGVNRRQKTRLAKKIITRFGGSLHGRRIAIWGLAFKPKTDDVREAPALTIIRLLADAGAEIVAFDPEAEDNARRELGNLARVSYAKNAYAALEGADALALVTEWGLFRSPDFNRMKQIMRQPIVFDGRNQYDPEHMVGLGFDYHGIGRRHA